MAVALAAWMVYLMVAGRVDPTVVVSVSKWVVRLVYLMVDSKVARMADKLADVMVVLLAVWTACLMVAQKV